MPLADHKAPFLAGTVASITGTAASLGIALSAFQALGATKSQTTSAIVVNTAIFGLLSIFLSRKYRIPISIVWSTPGAALLISSGELGLPFSDAVGAFIFSSLLLLLTGLWPRLGKLVSSIPKPIASAMLAGVIFSFCVATFKASAEWPLIVLPALIAWLVLHKVATVWATPVAMVLIFSLTAISRGITVPVESFLPTVEFVMPTLNFTAILSIGIPLYLVTMASQNIPGIAIMKNFGYEVPFKPVMIYTGASSVVANMFGGIPMNLAAITAALNANDEAHKDPARRWLAPVWGGYVYLVIAVLAGAAVAFVLQAPRQLILAAAGIALIGTIVNSLSAATEVTELRIPAMITFLIGASGISAFEIGSAFWALLAGVLVWAWLGRRKAV